jgi:hypothetical protein
MTINDKPTTQKNSKSNSPVVPQFASHGSAVPTAVPPYDAEKVIGGGLKGTPKPERSKRIK